MTASSSVSRLRTSLVALILVCVVQDSDMVFAWSGLNPAWWSIALLASTLAVVLAGMRLNQRLAMISAVLARSTQGDLSARIVGLRESGVLSDLVHRINHVLDLTDAFIREAEASILFVSRGRYFRRILTDGIPGDFTTRARAINAASEAMGAKLSGFGELTKGFEVEVGDVVQSVAGAAEGLTAAANRVGAASVTTTRNVQDAALAATQLGKAIEEIGQEVRHSTAIARRAVEEAGRTDRVVRELTDAAGRIAQVVDLIQDVAEQTNLLALNATIEAARAGEAGKGFAVVAGEVKALANQTAKATDEIRSQIQKMTDASRDAVEAVRVIHGTIGKIDDISSTIATAVEKQDAATREIASWVNDAATSVQGIATEIGGGSDQTAGRFSVSTAANDLSVQAAALRQSVGSYLGAVKAATGTSAARTG